MSLNLVVFVGFCLAVIQALSIPYRDISADSLRKIGESCLDEVHLDPTVVSQVLKTGILSQEDKYKKFLVCSYKKQGYLSHDGKRFNYETLDGMLKFLHYTSEELKQLDHCESIRASEPSELVYENLKCILEGLKKIDRMREMRKIEEELENNMIDTGDEVVVD
uniref:Putative odorant-binding protein 14 n=1 Tax=Anthonomus grandis TaxID=7044 RepID=A0A2P9JZF3_ANTGR|nr:putative odorant-binding protein 14 [Anthonomus grandis]